MVSSPCTPCDDMGRPSGMAHTPWYIHLPWTLWAGLFAAAVGLLGYWALEQDNFRTQRDYAQEQAWLRSGQMAQSVALQMQTLFAGLDVSLQTLLSHHRAEQRAEFETHVQALLRAYSPGAVVQVAMADAAGLVVYSNLGTKNSKQPPVSIAEREHFQAHVENTASGMFIGKPVRGKISEQWTIQLSRPIREAGVLQGVIVLSLAPAFFAHNFAGMTTGDNDIMALVRKDGTFLARSQRLDDALGQSLPPVQVQAFAQGGDQGRYILTPTIDNIERLFAWARVPGTGLIVLNGLDRAQTFASVERAIARSIRRDAFVSVIFLLGGALIAWMALQRQRQRILHMRDESRFAQLVQEVPGGLFQYRKNADGQGVLLFASPGFYALHGIPPLHGMLLGEQLAPCVLAQDLEALRESIRASVQYQSDWTHSYRIRNHQGVPLWLRGHARPVMDLDGSVIWHGYVQDVTQEQRLQQISRRLETLVGYLPSGILMTDPSGQYIVGANAQLVQVLHLLQPPQALEGLALRALGPTILAILQPTEQLSTAAKEAAKEAAKHVHLLDDGRYLEVQALALDAQDESLGLGPCWLISDVTERKTKELRLKTLALTDTLTGIPNRRAFFERLAMELSHLQSGLVDHAVLIMLDIDYFKRVNDQYGHAVGDLVLQSLVATIGHKLRKEDMMGRIGGEEFAVLLTATDAYTGLRRAEGLREAIAASVVQIEGQEPIHFAISLGVYALQPSDEQAEQCMERADAALYYSKRHGRNQSTLWHPELPAVAA